MAQRDIALRVGAALTCCTLLPFAAACGGIGVLFAVFAAQAPDAFDVKQEICCDTPDAWSQTFMLALLTAPAIALAAFLCFAVVSLAMTVVVNRGLSRRTLARSPLVAMALLVVALPISWIADSPQLRADCDTFTVQRADWRTTDRARWRSAEAIARCEPLRGQRARAVRGLLGAPDRRDRRSWVYVNAAGYDPDADFRHLRVLFRDGRVSAARFSF